MNLLPVRLANSHASERNEMVNYVQSLSGSLCHIAW